MNGWLPWIVGLGAPAFAGLWALWWKIEHRHTKSFERQDEMMTALKDSNDKEHQELRKQMTDQHHTLRDKIEKIWQKLSE